MLAGRGVFRGKRILSAQAVEAMAHDYTPDHHGYGLTMSVAEGTVPLLTLVNPGLSATEAHSAPTGRSTRKTVSSRSSFPKWWAEMRN